MYCIVYVSANSLLRILIQLRAYQRAKAIQKHDPILSVELVHITQQTSCLFITVTQNTFFRFAPLLTQISTLSSLHDYSLYSNVDTSRQSNKSALDSEPV